MIVLRVNPEIARTPHPPFAAPTSPAANGVTGRSSRTPRPQPVTPTQFSSASKFESGPRAADAASQSTESDHVDRSAQRARLSICKLIDMSTLGQGHSAASLNARSVEGVTAGETAQVFNTTGGRRGMTPAVCQRRARSRSGPQCGGSYPGRTYVSPEPRKPGVTGGERPAPIFPTPTQSQRPISRADTAPRMNAAMSQSFEVRQDLIGQCQSERSRSDALPATLFRGLA